jgi:hypothetical protein
MSGYDKKLRTIGRMKNVGSNICPQLCSSLLVAHVGVVHAKSKWIAEITNLLLWILVVLVG